MKKLRGFLYGHYDSRGGTTMVVANTKEEADNYYNFDDDSGCLATNDFMTKVELFFPDDFDLHINMDLEDYGRVICRGTEKDWPEWNNKEKETRDFFMFGGEDTIQILEFVPYGEKPVLLADGWAWPRWDDDAFGFIINKV